MTKLVLLGQVQYECSKHLVTTHFFKAAVAFFQTSAENQIKALDFKGGTDKAPPEVSMTKLVLCQVQVYMFQHLVTWYIEVKGSSTFLKFASAENQIKALNDYH